MAFVTFLTDQTNIALVRTEKDMDRTKKGWLSYRATVLKNYEILLIYTMNKKREYRGQLPKIQENTAHTLAIWRFEIWLSNIILRKIQYKLDLNTSNSYFKHPTFLYKTFF